MTNNERILAAMTKRFPNNNIAPEHYGSLLIEYLESGLSPPHIVAEIETGDEQKFWSAVWEAMLYRHLCQCGHSPRNSIRASGQHGPDFAIDHDGKTIWIEAVVPEPKGIPADWLEPPGREVRVKCKPDTERVVRCTSVCPTNTGSSPTTRPMASSALTTA